MIGRVKLLAQGLERFQAPPPQNILQLGTDENDPLLHILRHLVLEREVKTIKHPHYFGNDPLGGELHQFTEPPRLVLFVINEVGFGSLPSFQILPFLRAALFQLFAELFYPQGGISPGRLLIRNHFHIIAIFYFLFFFHVLGVQ